MAEHLIVVPPMVPSGADMDLLEHMCSEMLALFDQVFVCPLNGIENGLTKLKTFAQVVFRGGLPEASTHVLKEGVCDLGFLIIGTWSTAFAGHGHAIRVTLKVEVLGEPYVGSLRIPPVLPQSEDCGGDRARRDFPLGFEQLGTVTQFEPSMLDLDPTLLLTTGSGNHLVTHVDPSGDLPNGLFHGRIILDSQEPVESGSETRAVSRQRE